MKKKFSLLACILVGGILLNYRITYSDIRSLHTMKLTTWDALGYYMYLPGIFIYHDLKEIKWFFTIDQKYAVSGGKVYQANKLKNNNYVFKYLGGIAILEIPSFLAGHIAAKITGYAADGFSKPYQYALGFGNLLYVLLALFLLRHILLRYFSDLTAAITILLTFLATNIIQYAAIDNAMSHSPIFLLYVLVLYTTIKWHEKPRSIWAILTGYIIGLATICRPTEAIMFLIPLLWNVHTKDATIEKWKLVRSHRNHIWFAVLGGFIGILPQLIYWKVVTGSIIYDVGSAWDFLTPHIRVLTGWNKGWFIYTPVTVFFIAGMFFLKKYPFRKAVIYFCLINIYIIISWRDWRYGGSYSTRALSQSYPVFSLALASFIDYVTLRKWRYVFYAAGIYLIYLNIFQIGQYNSTILHYYDMNRKYYFRIYLDRHPTQLDMSLLDNKDWIRNEKKYTAKPLAIKDSIFNFKLPAYSSLLLSETAITADSAKNKKHNIWLKIESELIISRGLNGSYLYTILARNDSVKENKIRLFNPISKVNQLNEYAFYVKVPEYFVNGDAKLYLSSMDTLEGRSERITIFQLNRR